MIERVAKAMWSATHDGSWDDPLACPEDIRLIYHGDARVAIEAMREPTNAMLKAACASMSPGKRPTPERVPVKQKHRFRYAAMIDAALA